MLNAITGYIQNKAEQSQRALDFQKETLARYYCPPSREVRVPVSDQYVMLPYQYEAHLKKNAKLFYRPFPFTSGLRTFINVNDLIRYKVEKYKKEQSMESYAKRLQYIQDNRTFKALYMGLMDWADTMSCKFWVKLGKMLIK